MIYKKIFETFFSIFALVLLLVLMLHFLPGGPFDQESVYFQSQHLKEHWYFYSLVRSERSVMSILMEASGHSLKLSLATLVLVYVLSIAISTTALWAQKTWIYVMIKQINILFLSLPTLFVAPLLIYIFSIRWNLFSIEYGQGFSFYLLPIVTMSLRPLSMLNQLLMNEIEINIRKNHVITAYAKGLRHFHVMMRHVLRNSMVSLISYSPILIVSILSGSVVVEMLFSIPGMGTEFLKSLNERDYTVIVALTLVYGSLMIVLTQFFEWLRFYLAIARKENL